MAPSGTRSSVVYFHRSHIRQRKGHSRFVRKRVVTSSTVPSAVRSGSTRKACARQGSTRFFAPRMERIQASSKRGGSFVDGMERSPIGHFLLREQSVEYLAGGSAMLET